MILWSLLLLMLISGFIPFLHRGHRRRGLFLRAKELHLEGWRNTKACCICAVLSHWSSFSWILGLTTLVHSVAGDDGAHLCLESGRLLAWCLSKPKLGLEVTLLSLMKWGNEYYSNLETKHQGYEDGTSFTQRCTKTTIKNFIHRDIFFFPFSA